ncbi:hypothetical protein TcCL_ESM12642, partial [Trypanosoma cruzi]
MSHYGMQALSSSHCVGLCGAFAVELIVFCFVFVFVCIHLHELPGLFPCYFLMHSTSAVFLLFSFSHFCVQGVFGWVGEASVKMGEAFELLRFAALSSAVHADAVEC